MDIGKEKEKIERERKRLQEKEKFLKEKERRKRIERAKEIGKIAVKTEIDAMEKDLLLGAFLEIGERIGDENSVSSWRKKAEDFLGSLERTEESAC